MTTIFTKILAITAVVATLVASFGTPAAAVDFPAKGSTITFVVPYSPGGNSDTTTRLLALGLEKLWPEVNLVVLNKPGAGTQVGMLEVLKAKPDGYTLAHISSGGFFASYLRRGAPYSRKDFAPIASHQIGKQAVLVRADSPYKTLTDLLDAAKANPKQVKMGCASVLGSTHLGAIGLEKAAGVSFAIVNLKGGAEQATQLLGGHVDVILTGIDVVSQHIKGGTMRALAVVSSEESKYLPGVQTAAALGYDVQTNPMQGTAAPAGTPKEVVEILSKAIGDVLAMPETKAKFEAAGSEMFYRDAAEYAKILAREEQLTKQLIELATKSAN